MFHSTPTVPRNEIKGVKEKEEREKGKKER
jgi:hypothetical protein